MSGLEVLGAIASIIAIIEASIGATEFIGNIFHFKKEQHDTKVDLEMQLDIIMISLESFIQENDTSSSVSDARVQKDFLEALKTALQGIRKCVEKIEKVLDNSKRWRWKFDKKKIQELLSKLESTKSLLTLALTGKTM